MTGENFKRVNRGGQIKDLKDKIQSLKNQCGKMYRDCRDYGEFDEEKYEKLCKEIELQEYLLWGATKGILR